MYVASVSTACSWISLHHWEFPRKKCFMATLPRNMSGWHTFKASQIWILNMASSPVALCFLTSSGKYFAFWIVLGKWRSSLLLLEYLIRIYTGWPNKNGTAYFPQYVDAITGIGVWDNFSWEKWYQDQQFLFSSCFFLGHILWDNVEAPNFPFST